MKINYRTYLKKIASAKQAEESWLNGAKACWDRYSSNTSDSSNGASANTFNIFKANTDILLGSLFNVMPKPDVRRRFSKKTTKDAKKDSLYRTVSQVADYSIQWNNEVQDTQKELEKVFKDGFITGRGVSFQDYDYEEDENGDVEKQTAKIRHVPYDQYLEETSKEEKDITWKAQKLLLSKKDITKQFNKETAKSLNYNYKVSEVDGNGKRAEVWEIWDKKNKLRIYVCPASLKKEPLRIDKDPFNLEGFFPFKTFKTIENGKNTLPTPEYNIYKKLNIQLQQAIDRQGNLTQNHIKYMPLISNKDKGTVSTALSGSDGEVIGVQVNPNTSGGVLANVGAIPTEEARSIVDFLEMRSQVLVKKIWDITGISDIMRGQSDAQETATAQKIKGVFGTLRIKPRQKQVQNFIKDCFKSSSEIVCEKFTIKTMQEITCIDLPSQEDKQKFEMDQIQAQQNQQPIPEELKTRMNEPTWEEVAEVLRNDKLRSYTIDIETTATVFDDIETERNQINQFTQTVTSMLNQTAQFVAQSPSTIDLLEQLTLLNASNFRVSRGYIDSIKNVFVNVKREIEQKAQQPAPVDPMIEIKKQEMMIKTQEAQARGQLEMAKVDLARQKLMIDSNKTNSETSIKTQELGEKALNDRAIVSDKNRQTEVKQQEADRKDRELNIETTLTELKIQTGGEIDTNIGIN